MKRIPERMCLVCRKTRPRTEMIRMVRRKDRGISWDEEYTLSGKGLYVCRESACLREFADGRKYRKNFAGLLEPECRVKLKEVIG